MDELRPGEGGSGGGDPIFPLLNPPAGITYSLLWVGQLPVMGTRWEVVHGAWTCDIQCDEYDIGGMLCVCGRIGGRVK